MTKSEHCKSKQGTAERWVSKRRWWIHVNSMSTIRVAPKMAGTRGVNWVNIEATWLIDPLCGYHLSVIGLEQPWRLSEIMQAGKAGDGQHLAALWQFINLSRGYFTVLPLTSSYQQSFTVTPQQGRYNSPPVGSNPVSNLGQFCWKDAGSQRINLLFLGEAKKVSSTCSIFEKNRPLSKTSRIPSSLSSIDYYKVWIWSMDFNL